MSISRKKRIEKIGVGGGRSNGDLELIGKTARARAKIVSCVSRKETRHAGRTNVEMNNGIFDTQEGE